MNVFIEITEVNLKNAKENKFILKSERIIELHKIDDSEFVKTLMVVDRMKGRECLFLKEDYEYIKDLINK